MKVYVTPLLDSSPMQLITVTLIVYVRGAPSLTQNKKAVSLTLIRGSGKSAVAVMSLLSLSKTETTSTL